MQHAQLGSLFFPGPLPLFWKNGAPCTKVANWGGGVDFNGANGEELVDYVATTPVDGVAYVLSYTNEKEFVVVAALLIELRCVAGCVPSVLKSTSCAECDRAIARVCGAGAEAATPKVPFIFVCGFLVCFA